MPTYFSDSYYRLYISPGLWILHEGKWGEEY
jgi:hypothetical protein